MLKPVSPKHASDIFRSRTNVGSLRLDYLVMTVLGCIIAVFRLILNSTAGIMGAIRIVPLMVLNR